MLIGTLAELMTIGAVLPFLALIADPTRAVQVPLFGAIAVAAGVKSQQDLILLASLLLIAAAIFTAMARVLLTWISLQFVLILSHEIGATVYARMLRQPYGYYVTRNTSELIASQEKVQAVVWAVLMPSMQGITAAFMALAIVVLLFAIDPFTATAAAAAMSLSYLGVSLAVRRRLHRNSERLASGAAARIKTIQEGLGGIRDVLLEQSQEVFEKKFCEVDYAYRRAQVVNNLIGLGPRYVVEATGIVLFVALTLYLSNRPGGVIASISVLGALAVGAQRLLPLLQQAYSGWSSFAGNRQMLADVVALMRAPIVTSIPRDRAQPPVSFKRDIRFDRVSFQYDRHGYALQNINLLIPKGERLGMVGETGSGKSTLLDLLMGLLEPTSGTIMIDGEPLGDSNRANWQAQIAHVPQAIYLSDSSIASNIAFGEAEDEFDMNRVRDAAARAHIAQFIAELRDGFETTIGERGVRLSGGQRQRIGIARALYKRAEVLVFDEATSALDSKVEAAIMQAIFELERKVTLIMIAHRTTTLSGCDRIVRLAGGKIVEVGSYDDLLGGKPWARRPGDQRG